MISALRDINDKNSSKITISPEIMYQHIWQGDVIRGPGSCDLLVDATLNGISFLDSKGKRSNASGLFDKFNAHFTQNYCVQPLPQTDRLFKEGGALRQSKVISGSNFLLSHVEQRDVQNKWTYRR